MIEAFVTIHEKRRDINLVITGENKRIRENLEELIRKFNLKESVIFTGYVDDKTLTTIIKSALLVCYPTLSEGFGFPVLEGFGAGVPVISSNTSAIPEIAGKAALLINPESTLEISNAIQKVLSGKSLAQNMILKGKSRYNEFSWEKSINEYIDLYNNI